MSIQSQRTDPSYKHREAWFPMPDREADVVCHCDSCTHLFMKLRVHGRSHLYSNTLVKILMLYNAGGEVCIRE